VGRDCGRRARRERGAPVAGAGVGRAASGVASERQSPGRAAETAVTGSVIRAGEQAHAGGGQRNRRRQLD
jgi:hypothetical protein